MFSRKGSKMKEEERIEKAIRSLLKLPENRRCINCNSLGPQYVCTTFWTFVCTNCSGIHREFTHRVKSVSMAKFTAEEVGALEAGGNERARQIYFKEWDFQRNAYPDGSPRDFIKSVYVDRKYSSESNDKVSRLRMADTECSDESKKASVCTSASRSPQKGDKSERSSYERTRAYGKNGDGSLKFNLDEKRNTGHTRHNSRSRGLPKSSIRFEIVDDRFRDDGGVKRYDGRSSSNKDARGHSRSLDLSNKTDRLSSPVARPIQEILGDKAPQLRVGNVVKVDGKNDTVDDAVQNKKMVSSFHKNTVEQKTKTPESLMNDIPDSKPSDSTTAPVKQLMPQSTDNNNQASSELPVTQKAIQGPDPNSLEALLFGLSVPSVGTGVDNSELYSKSESSSTTSVSKHPAANTETQMSGTPKNIDNFAVSPSDLPAQSSNAGPSGPAFTAVADKLYTKEPGAPGVTANDQPLVASTPPDFEGTSGSSMQQVTQAISNSVHDQSPRVESEAHKEETKTGGRKELPEDLFTGGFSFAYPQVHNWEPGLPHGIGFGMPYYQYPRTMGAHNYTAKPTNPFDVDSDTAPVRAPQFPSMAFMHGALPQVSVPRGFPVAGSLGMMAPHSPSYAAALSPRSPSFASALSPGAYMAQQPHMNMLLSPRRHVVDGLNTEGNALNSANAFHLASSGYASANPNPYNSRGNPFG